jgi:hypothetical protein
VRRCCSVAEASTSGRTREPALRLIVEQGKDTIDQICVGTEVDACKDLDDPRLVDAVQSRWYRISSMLEALCTQRSNLVV